jgi:hypothetical protein
MSGAYTAQDRLKLKNPLVLPMAAVCCVATTAIDGCRARPNWSPETADSQNLRRNSGLWIKLEQVSEVRRKSLTGLAKIGKQSC